MSEEAVHQHHDDQSHYEISLTAGQAFVAFVLLLLSLAASFAFGLMIGKGQADERLVVRKEPSVVTEANMLPGKKPEAGKIVELGVADDDFAQTESAPATDTTATEVTVTTATDGGAAELAPPTSTQTAGTPAPADQAGGPRPAAPTVTPVAPPAQTAPAVPVYAQLLSTSDQKTAEALAVKLINGGFNSAYVIRGTSDKGPIFRVRVKFSSESEAHAAEAKLKGYSSEVWITKQ